jgi:tRNA dimethylallyltransferase
MTDEILKELTQLFSEFVKTTQENKIVVIFGPTATGKTKLALALAEKIGTEIISADSIQVYKEFNVCNAKPSANELSFIKHHLINHISVSEEYSVGRFCEEAKSIITRLYQSGKIPIIAGGTGLYIDALLKNFNFQKSANEIKEEIYKSLKIGLNFYERKKLYKMINIRTDKMFKNGLTEEVKFVRENFKVSKTASAAIGYKEVLPFLDGLVTLEEAVETVKLKTRQYAKRQITWFRREKNTHWFFI